MFLLDDGSVSRAGSPNLGALSGPPLWHFLTRLVFDLDRPSSQHEVLNFGAGHVERG